MIKSVFFESKTLYTACKLLSSQTGATRQVYKNQQGLKNE
ncbi:hypothetical protein N483_03220 [Pseudoalteromonas luteoviolacea NCIMB 1944]|nr:hypothetical protein N483_03220 [Pseudoalteromonas luteoviolacea NCIMB 1944]